MRSIILNWNVIHRTELIDFHRWHKAERRYQQFYSYSGAGTVLMSEFGIELESFKLVCRRATVMTNTAC